MTIRVKTEKNGTVTVSYTDDGSTITVSDSRLTTDEQRDAEDAIANYLNLS